MTEKESSAGARPPRRALGRGLSALLESRRTTAVAPEPRAGAAPTLPTPTPGPNLRQIPVDTILRSPDQPRKKFPAESLEELAASIRAHGLLQPVVVAPASAAGPGKFQLIAGERRWRAAQLAGLPVVPAIVREAPKGRALELSLVENLQREDLNPIEAAEAFDRLVQEFGLTHEEIARQTGKDRATITNLLRLLRLPAEVQRLLTEGKISVGHAKALLGLVSPAEQRRVGLEIVRRDLSVRSTERLVASRSKSGEAGGPTGRSTRAWDPNIRAALQDLERTLGTRVRLSGSSKKGRLLIEYYSAEDLMRLYDIIMGHHAQ